MSIWGEMLNVEDVGSADRGRAAETVRFEFIFSMIYIGPILRELSLLYS